MSVRRVIMVAIAAAAVPVIPFGSIGVASADSQPANPPTEETTYVTMTAQSIDRDQAAAAGNIVREEGGFELLIDGRTGEEIARFPLPGTITTQDWAYGNCGRSYLTIDDFNGADGTLGFRTGFVLDGPDGGLAINFHWEVIFDGPRTEVVWEDNGPMVPDTTWASGNKTVPLNGAGFYSGLVDPESNALLASGLVCGSASPVSSGYAS